jgi:uncharacterized protein
MYAGSRAAALAALLWWTLAVAGDGMDEAIASLTMRAEAGDLVAQLELAGRYSRGDGVAADPDVAGHWLVRAAQGGHVEARAILGTILLEQATTAEETQAAIEWLTAAAEAGNTLARLLLGQTALEAGRGEEAVQHFVVAAEAGDAATQVGLGLIHSNGENVPVDHLEALHWFRLAALQGHPGGQRGIGALLANGDAGPVDLDAGYFWFSLAAAADAVAAEYADELARELDAAQREAVQALVRAWRPGEPGPALLSVVGYADVTIDLYDEIQEDQESTVAPRREERWRFTDAVATRRAPGYFPGEGAVIELLLLSEALAPPEVWRWLGEGGFPPQPRSLSVLMDNEGRPLGGMMHTSEGYVGVPASSLEADLLLRHGRLGGGLRAVRGDSRWPFDELDVRVLVEVRGGG